jgi:hypothetical protein
VGAQGDLCTDSIFWCTVSPHLFYSASSPVPPKKDSVLHNGTSSYVLGSISLPKLLNLNSPKAIAICSCRFIVVHITPTRSGELASHAGGGHTYDGVLPCAPKGSSLTLLAPPQCHEALGTMPHTLVSMDQSPQRGRLELDFGGEIRSK